MVFNFLQFGKWLNSKVIKVHPFSKQDPYNLAGKIVFSSMAQYLKSFEKSLSTSSNCWGLDLGLAHHLWLNYFKKRFKILEPLVTSIYYNVPTLLTELDFVENCCFFLSLHQSWIQFIYLCSESKNQHLVHPCKYMYSFCALSWLKFELFQVQFVKVINSVGQLAEHKSY